MVRYIVFIIVGLMGGRIRRNLTSIFSLRQELTSIFSFSPTGISDGTTTYLGASDFEDGPYVISCSSWNIQAK